LPLNAAPQSHRFPLDTLALNLFFLQNKINVEDFHPQEKPSDSLADFVIQQIARSGTATISSTSTALFSYSSCWEDPFKRASSIWRWAFISQTLSACPSSSRFQTGNA